MNNHLLMPDYLFESSWEVCNKIGGIYTVLSTKARTLQERFKDNVVFIGPDLGGDAAPSDFVEGGELFPDWKEWAQRVDGLKIKVGRWHIPGTPPVVLIDFKPFFPERDRLFYALWEEFKVDSMHAYGDYDESCIFAYAVGKVIESFYRFYHLDDKKVVAHFNEWTLGMGALYVKKRLPGAGVVFTTHATSIGRSIAGNGKPLYACMEGYNGDQMAQELHMEAKHSLEKQTAHYADCFTTVSDITAKECVQLLDKSPDCITPNGFEPDFVPEGEDYTGKRIEARRVLITTCEKLFGCRIDPDALLVSTGGRYEYRNKGIDVFIEAMDMIRTSGRLRRDTVAFILVPAWVRDARADLKMAIEQDIPVKTPLQTPFVTHWLNGMTEDKVLNFILRKGFTNAADEPLKIVFVPCYLDGKDGIFNHVYYDLLIGMDMTVYPSYYEPWGYTPLESIAFGIPAITTNLAGFGLWSKKEGAGDGIDYGVHVIDRTDTNYFDVAGAIARSLLSFAGMGKEEVAGIRERCFDLASRAEWRHFITHYLTAYHIALTRAGERK
ncbi:MAG: glycogen/starch synthase [Tannerellaceae bacterium]|nr:glycogen/starch synthase [Tannerellaceae bacterium]